MSVCYWMCEGIGVRSSDIYPLLNKEKCFNEVQRLYPDNTALEDFELNDYLDGDCFQNLGDFLYQLDDTETTNWGDNGDDETYFLYSPKYPWQVTSEDPKSREEARALIKRTLLKVCDVDDETLERLIDNDIYEYGCG